MFRPIPRQQFIKPMRGMGGDAREDVGEPSLQIDAIHFRRDNETVHGRSALPAAIRRDLIMPGVWDTRLRLRIHFIRFAGGCRWSLPISSMTAIAI